MPTSNPIPYLNDDEQNPLGIFAQSGPNPLIADAKQSMAAPPDAAPANADAPLKMLGDDSTNPLAQFNLPQLPNVVPSQHLGDLDDREAYDREKLKKIDTPYDYSQHGWLRNTGHVLAGIGNVAGDILDPGATALIPHSYLNNDLTRTRLNSDLADVNQERQTDLKDFNADQQSKALTNYTSQRPEIEQSKIDQKQQAVQDKITQAAAARGQTVAFDPEGVPTFADNPDLQAYHSQAAKIMLNQAQTEREQVLSQMGQPGTPLYEQKQRELDQIDHRIGIAQQQLALRGQQFVFDQDKFYNPQPTATERRTADFANSAINRVQEMRDIIARHPDAFGPGAGRATNFQAFMGSQDPDVQKYLSAGQYLADHSAAVFGGRGQYIMQQLHSLTDPKSNPEALNAALDEAETTAREFAKAGQLHGKPGTAKTPTKGGQQHPPAAPQSTGLGVTLSSAMALPQNKGKTEDEVVKDIEAHGHKVIR